MQFGDLGKLLLQFQAGFVLGGFGFFALGDVAGDADDAQRLAAVVEQQIGDYLGVDDVPVAVRLLHLGHRVARRKIAALDAGNGFGNLVTHLHRRFRRQCRRHVVCHDFCDGIAAQALHRWTDIAEAPAIEFHHPDHIVHVFRQQAEMLFAFAKQLQRFLMF